MMKLKVLANSMVGLLILEFLLGILTNLYIEIPEKDPTKVFEQFSYINLHALVGALAIILGIVIFVKTRGREGFGQAIGGFVNVLLAFAFGITFVLTQQDLFSLLMALAFIGALMSYARLAWMTK